MADFGATGTYYGTTTYYGKPYLSRVHRTTRTVTEYGVAGLSKETTEGSPSQPSLKLNRHGMFRFRWTVNAGSRGISVSVKQAANVSPRPTLVVRANPEIGVNSDVTETAGSGTGWVTIGPASISPSSRGAVWVELHNNYDSQGGACYFDNIVAT